MTAKERHRAAVFARDPHVCALEGHGVTCEGPLQADHILRISALMTHRDRLRLRRGELSDRQRRFLETDPGEWIADERNGWILCERHHSLKDRRMIYVAGMVALPMHLASFIADYDLLGVYGDELHPRTVPGSANGSRGPGASFRGI